MRVLRPGYRSTSNQDPAWSPLEVAGVQPTVDVAGLARLFTGPGLYGEFQPSSYWVGVDLVHPRPRPSEPPIALSKVFARAVADLCADSESVGVKLSGGLDSLAVLSHVAALRPLRRIVTFCVDLIDDAGVQTSEYVQGLLSNLHLQVERVFVDPSRCLAASPQWSPHGPRLDALPSANAAVAELAAERGVGVLLNGDGADELLGVPRFAAKIISQAAGTSSAARYAWDTRRSGPGIPGELLALAADHARVTARAWLYWAMNWPEWCRATVAEVVTHPLRGQARAWADDWIRSQIAGHVALGRTWVQADAFDSIWPYGFTPSARDFVTEASPYLHEDFVAAALALPLEARYDALLPTPYQRCKASVVRLLPESVRTTLPTRKHYYTTALTRACNSRLEVPTAAAAGVLDPEALARTSETAVRMNAAAVESWLSGAAERGFVVPGV